MSLKCRYLPKCRYGETVLAGAKPKAQSPRNWQSISIECYGTRPGCSFKLQSLFCYKSSKCSLTSPLHFTAAGLLSPVTIQTNSLAPCTWCNCICTDSYSFVMAWLSIELCSNRKPLSVIGKGGRVLKRWMTWRIRNKFNNRRIAKFLPGSHWASL